MIQAKNLICCNNFTANKVSCFFTVEWTTINIGGPSIFDKQWSTFCEYLKFLSTAHIQHKILNCHTFSDRGFFKKFESCQKTATEIETIIFSETQSKDEYISIMFKLYKSLSLIPAENTNLATNLRFEDSVEIHDYLSSVLAEKYGDRVEVMRIKDLAVDMKKNMPLETIEESSVEDDFDTIDDPEVIKCLKDLDRAINENDQDLTLHEQETRPLEC